MPHSLHRLSNLDTTTKESFSKSSAVSIVAFLNVTIFIYLRCGHPLKIVKSEEQDIDAFFADIKVFAMRIQDLSFG